MTTAVTRALPRVSLPPRLAVALGLFLLMAASLVLRIGVFGIGFWIDEGISVGIADRPLGHIPDALRQDGSPPLYYFVLHFWMGVAGESEQAVRSLSLLCALLAVPAAFWAADVLFGRRAAWFAAILAATDPFLTQYAQETRMYALVVLLGLLVCALYGRAFTERERGVTHPRRALAFGAALAVMLYTHNWALFLGAALGIAWLVLLALAEPGRDRRALWRDGLAGFGTAAVLYLPWVPSTLYQARHTGAPWARAPRIDAFLGTPGILLGPEAQLILLIAAGAGLAVLLRHGWRERGDGRTTFALLVAGFGTIAIAWTLSQVSPAWANRYLAAALAPLLLVSAAGLSRAGRLGLAGLAVVCVLWAEDGPPKEKSNVREVAEAIAPGLTPGDTVLSTQPEQAPALHYYLGDDYRYATLWGPVADRGVADWRDGVDHMRATSPEHDLDPLLDGVPVGRHLVLVEPIVYDVGRWSAPWTKEIRLRSRVWLQHMGNDGRFTVVQTAPGPGGPTHPNPVRAWVFLKTAR